MPHDRFQRGALDMMVWHRGLAVPAVRDIDNPSVARGKELFQEIGCALRGVQSRPVSALENRRIQSVWQKSVLLLLFILPAQILVRDSIEQTCPVYADGFYAVAASRDPEVQAAFPAYIESVDPDRTHPEWFSGDVEKDILAYINSTSLSAEASDQNYIDMMVWHRGLAVPAGICRIALLRSSMPHDRFQRGARTAVMKTVGILRSGHLLWSLCVIVRRRLYVRPAVFMLHVSFLVIR